MALNGRAATVISVGVLFAWSGIKGWSLLGTAKDLVTGVKPSGIDMYPLGGSPVQTYGRSISGPKGLADSAILFTGHAYKFGGAPGKDGGSPWDCSSMVNYIAARMHSLAIPGYSAGSYDGTVHGPATGQWAVWNGVTTIPRSQVGAGDIVIWAGHMGIAISNDQMVSALNESEGTRQTKIDGTAPGPIIRCARYIQ